MWEDIIVKEIRAIREQHAAQYNYDLQAIAADIKQQEQKNIRAKFVTRPSRKPVRWSISSENQLQVSRE